MLMWCLDTKAKERDPKMTQDQGRTYRWRYGRWYEDASSEPRLADWEAELLGLPAHGDPRLIYGAHGPDPRITVVKVARSNCGNAVEEDAAHQRNNGEQFCSTACMNAFNGVEE
jgi:hypothetical protein